MQPYTNGTNGSSSSSTTATTTILQNDSSSDVNGIHLIPSKDTATHLNPAATASTITTDDTTPLLVRWYKLLFTKEDYLHHHKTLGILCLLSFLFRVMNYPNDMGFHKTSIYHSLTIPTVLIHSLLTISSFQFKIPPRRIRDGGRIWPQYRYHSLIFTLRSTCLVALYYYEDIYNIEQPLYYMNYIIIMVAMAAVEYVNYMVGPNNRSNTIREVDGNPYVKFFFSTLQLHVMSIFLLGIRRAAIPFYAMFAVQITPFIGTLRRKGIFTNNILGMTIYGGMLIGGVVVQTYYLYEVGGEQLNLFIRCIGCIAALFRFTHVIPKSLFFLQSKFFIWTVMYFVIDHYRTINFDIDIVVLRKVFGVLLVLLALQAHYKVQSGFYPKDVKHAKEMKMK